ncbi:unnamed protein product, partial [Tetraodon nigroviridis]
QLEELLNPLPKFEDPEDEDDEATKAKVTERLHEDDDEADSVAAPSALRRRASAPLETDGRYAGKKVSRKQLLMDVEESADSDDDLDEDAEGREAEEELSDEGGFGEEDAESDEDDSEEDEGMTVGDAPLNAADLIFPQKVDFHKLTDGMDDLGVSEDEDDDDDDDDDDTTGEETVDGEEDGASGGSEAENQVEEEGAVHTFSQDRADEEVEKGKAVKSQLALWDRVLEGRIKIQKALATANQLPQPPTFPEFRRRGGEGFASGLKDAHKALKALQRSLLELHDQLLLQKDDTRSVALGKEGSEGGEDPGPEAAPPKRKLEMAAYPALMAKRFAAFQPFQSATLQKWHDRTRLSAGRSGRGFGAFDRNVVTQVEQVLADRERLVRRTQTPRSEYTVLGKKEAPALAEGEEAQRQLQANAHLKAADEDVFDDDDFYHQLLRELIQHKTSAADANQQVALGRQWLAIQKLRSKIRRKVDTKASKGRKVQFQTHSKLVSFMVPVDRSSLSERGRSELFRGLFGQTPAPL